MANPKCVSIDLEVSRSDERILRIGAVRGEDQRTFSTDAANLGKALRQLDAFSEGSVFLLGHNIIEFDLPRLRSANPQLRLLELPVIDTLRLNPLAFPRNPYHHLVKHYQDAGLKRRQTNDPTLDARLALKVFLAQRAALADADSDLLLAWHWLSTIDAGSAALNALFMTLRNQPRPSPAQALAAMGRVLDERACAAHARHVLNDRANEAWSLAYALAWLSVSGEKSVMPPWVRHQFPKAGEIVRLLRDTPCDSNTCDWCDEHHDARKVLKRFFGFDAYRPEPVMTDGTPMQQAIVESAMRGRHVLGILPTGTGKSICYQVPALSRYFNTGALSVVISPLVALMVDQVEGLRERGIDSAATLNSLLSLPERADVLDNIRLGEVSILIISPEQLRSRSVRRVLEQREIGAWIIDEAHCLSKWGHDFRPDYRYIGRYIRERAGESTVPPILCLTATAKPEVIAEIIDHFQTKLGVELQVFNGGSNRSNLEFEVIPTTEANKYEDVHQLLTTYLPEDQPGGAIVYCATKARTEELAQHLRSKEVNAGFFHAGLKPEAKQTVQRDFIAGRLRVITATNAFGMGIDKPDVRVVIHADIPGSLENYLQEAGRAGRDRDAARCVLLYAVDDVERQFSMSARSRLSRREIQTILRSLKRLQSKRRVDDDIIATSGEILAEDDEADFGRDSATDDTRVRTAVCWLEEAELITRSANFVEIFPSSLRVGSLEEASQKLAVLAPQYQRQLRAIVASLLDADSDEGVSTDLLSGVSGLEPQALRKAFFDLEHLGVAKNDTVLTAYVHAGIENSSLRRFEKARELEVGLLAHLREHAPDLQAGDASTLHLRHATRTLHDAGLVQASPLTISNLIKGLARDGRGDEAGLGSLRTRRIDADHLEIRLQRAWSALDETARLRREAAGRLLEHLVGQLPTGSRGTDLLAETTLGQLTAVIEQDALLHAQTRNVSKLVDTALLWLHDQKIIRLNKGLAVFRPAMTIRLGTDRRSFTNTDFEPLRLHYGEQVLQVHVMAEYATRGLQAMADAVHLAMDYFRLRQDEFLRRWLPGKDKEISRQTTPASWQAIVEALRNPAQQRIVQDDREQANVLVLAGPGSGKTRVLVHRIAYLIRARREKPAGILALAYNRHAAVEIRRRLHDLIGNDAFGVTILTCHALAMRLTGTSLIDQDSNQDIFSAVLRQATDLLNGIGLLPEEADEQRERLLAGFRWILVDEYQDIAKEHYELISALAGRTLKEDDSKLTLFAVGDDDQNIYTFNGASVEFIRRFEQDYQARPSYLIENYRSSGHIVEASNRLISHAVDRLKHQHPIEIDKARRKDPPGGVLQHLDRVGKGRVQILQCEQKTQVQAVAAVMELERLAALQPDWDWNRTAIIAREWRYLEPVRAYCELRDIPVQMADNEVPGVWRLRETQALIGWIRTAYEKPLCLQDASTWLSTQPDSVWNRLLLDAITTYTEETGVEETLRPRFLEWLAEWSREIRRQQSGLLLLSAHRAKGLEFDHLVVLDGGWNRSGANEDRDAARRLYYVAMTRARTSLCLMRMEGDNPFLETFAQTNCCQWRSAPELESLPTGIDRRYQQATLADVDLSFAGRHSAHHAVHRAIARLQPGNALQLVARNGRLELQDGTGTTVGRMSRSFTPLREIEHARLQVAAITTRKKDDGSPEFRRSIQCEQWEVVIPSLVYD